MHNQIFQNFIALVGKSSVFHWVQIQILDFSTSTPKQS